MAAAALWRGRETFTGGTLAHRPAGSVIVVDELPSGVACRAYGDKDPERPEWLPYEQWRGEKTWHPSKELQADKHRPWWHFDAEGKQLGPLARRISHIIRGKDNPLYDPIADVGAFVIVTNCEKVRVPGKAYHYRLYVRNLSRRPGHCKVERFKDLQKRFPERIIMKAVWGAMPKTKSARRIFKERLKLFTGPNHMYYDMNPIDYPMHKLPDCTWETNLRFKDRLSKWVESRGPSYIQHTKEKQAKKSSEALKIFKKFLVQQLNEHGEDFAKDMSVKEFVKAVESKKAAEVRAQTEGQTPPRRKIAMYPNTRIPVQKVVSKNRHRDLKWLMGTFR